MVCPNCKTNSWENVDFARIKPSGMSICVCCGFVSYPDKWKQKDEIIKHYRSGYRPPPTHMNSFTGERKNHFHNAFLNDLFIKWKKEGLESPRVLEIGSAFGFTLNWIRNIFPKSEICGTELTTSMRRVAKHEFNIKLDEDFDDTKKYDLIISYKVLEHQLDPDIELKRYQKCLSEKGKLYISVPTWFDTMSNFGLGGFDLEYYYDTNHINVWTRKIFEGMLKSNGLKITKKDTVIYSSTYLCEADDSLFGSDHISESIDDIKKSLHKIKDAYFLCMDNKFEDAIKLWPDYPTAHTNLCEFSRKELKTKGWEWFKENRLERAISDCPNSADALILATDFAMRAEKFKEAILYCERALLAKPENPVSLHAMCNIMREMAIRGKTKQEKEHYFTQAREVAKHLRNVSSQHFREATDLIYLFSSHLPIPDELNNLDYSNGETVHVESEVGL